jgi:Tol biopolymer transport system component
MRIGVLFMACFIAGCPGPGGTVDGGGDDGGLTDSSSGGDGDAVATDGGVSGYVVLFASSRALDGSDATGPNSAYNLWSINADGTNLHAITKLINANSTRPAWSPDGKHIVFESERALDGSDALNVPPADSGFKTAAVNIWVVNADGTGATALTHLSISASIEPRWSPDGTKILFHSGRPSNGADGAAGTSNAWIMDADGNNQKPLTQFVNTVTSQPTQSPDGSRIAYSSQGALDGSDAMLATTNIWTMNSNITSPQPLTMYTAAGAGVGHPSWSNDSSKILFDSAANPNGTDAALGANHGNIWTVTVATPTKTALTKFSTAEAFVPSYSPNGTRIAYASNGTLDGNDTINTNGTGNVWVMNADGSGQTALTKNQHVDYDYPDVSWSGDGALLVFTSERNVDGSDSVSPNEVTNLWVMNADGSNLHALTKTTASYTDSDSATFRP